MCNLFNMMNFDRGSMFHEGTAVLWIISTKKFYTLLDYHCCLLQCISVYIFIMRECVVYVAVYKGSFLHDLVLIKGDLLI